MSHIGPFSDNPWWLVAMRFFDIGCVLLCKFNNINTYTIYVCIHTTNIQILTCTFFFFLFFNILFVHFLFFELFFLFVSLYIIYISFIFIFSSLSLSLSCRRRHRFRFCRILVAVRLFCRTNAKKHYQYKTMKKMIR